MTSTEIQTVNVVDARIEPRPAPVYMRPIAPKQNQFYKLPASGLSNSYVTFNNIVVLGKDRAYLDTFELEITADITFTANQTGAFRPAVDEWIFDSFPFNKCCEEARVNINGISFFSNPLLYLRAKERYWNDDLIAQSYGNICPCNKPYLQNEIDMDFSTTENTTGLDIADRLDDYVFRSTTNSISATVPAQSVTTQGSVTGISGTDPTAARIRARGNPATPQVTPPNNIFWANSVKGVALEGEGTVGVSENGDDANYTTALEGYLPADSASHLSVETTGTVPPRSVDGVAYNDTGFVSHGASAPTRLPVAQKSYMPTASGIVGSKNNTIVRYGPSGSKYKWSDDGKSLVVTVTWREPIFCTPFSTRIDATFGRPLYNITSMDLAFNLQNLGNMIRLANLRTPNKYVENYNIDLRAVQLCYQVETVPPSITPPPMTVLPYRRFVPYITDYPKNSSLTPAGGRVEMTSGVYTMNEVPTAIWIFAAPTLDKYQTNPSDSDANTHTGLISHGQWVSNKQFAFLKHISISMANTTQMLNTADVPDLYRIAKQNGCQDSFQGWAGDDIVETRLNLGFNEGLFHRAPLGPGSVLRLIPGTDLVLPDQDLIPGANANNMVFQVTAEFNIPPHSPNLNTYALWILFEYVGVATITPGQGSITMNPMGNGGPFVSAPVASAASVTEEPTTTTTTTTGSGWWDTLKEKIKKGHDWLKENKIASKLLAYAPGAVGSVLSNAASALGYGIPAKRGRTYGGAVMDLDDFT